MLVELVVDVVVEDGAGLDCVVEADGWLGVEIAVLLAVVLDAVEVELFTAPHPLIAALIKTTASQPLTSREDLPIPTLPLSNLISTPGRRSGSIAVVARRRAQPAALVGSDLALDATGRR